MRAQSLQRRDDCFLIHLYRVGDHTRGLFEAEASITVSAAHTLEDVKIFLFIGHCALLQANLTTGIEICLPANNFQRQ
jgi:hypothetical protein